MDDQIMDAEAGALAGDDRSDVSEDERAGVFGVVAALREHPPLRDESLYVAPLLDAARARGLHPETCAMDKGYDHARVYDECRERDCIGIICLRKGRPIPLSPIPHGSDEWKRLYRGRGAVEREFGRLKHDYGLGPLRVRGIARVQLHADLTMMGRLGQALIRARTAPVAAAA